MGYKVIVVYKCRFCGETIKVQTTTPFPVTPVVLLDDSAIPPTFTHTCFKYESIDAEMIGIADKVGMRLGSG